MSKVVDIEKHLDNTGVYELRYYRNRYSWDVIDRYDNYPLAHGMLKKKNREEPKTFPLENLGIVKV